MVTDRRLKAELLAKLDVTPQRLSQRVGEVKSALGPMTTPEATYVIAHLEGFDLSKYLAQELVERVRMLVSSSDREPRVKKTSVRAGSNKEVVVRISSEIPKVDALLSTVLARDAKRMAALYPKYYVFENSLRCVIERILETKYGQDWWQKRASPKVKAKVRERRDKEVTQPWHGKRGQHEIYYSDFGDLRKIIERNWDDFADLFPTRSWITQKLDELEPPRNIIAHHNPVSADDERRLDLYFRDWIALLTVKKEQIP